MSKAKIIPERITPQWVREQVAEILSFGNSDPETSHGMEDGLYVDVLKAIAEGRCGRQVRACAEEAFKLSEANMTRWYA